MHGPTPPLARRLAGLGMVCVGLALVPGTGGHAPGDAGAPAAQAVPDDTRPIFAVRVTVTGYSSTPDQTDATPFVTASSTRVRPGVLALSRDLLREYTPAAPFGFGDRVEIPGVGVFRVEDTMAARFSRRADIWFESRGQARTWGKRHGLDVIRLGAEQDYAGRVDPRDPERFRPALAD